MDDKIDRRIPRRAVIAALGTGAMAVGTLAAPAQARDRKAHWQPALEPQDQWMDLPGRHRLVFDSISADGAGEALAFAGNYIAANKKGYGLEPSQLATIIILRHFATVFAYDDAMWSKYGAAFSKLSGFKDPKTSEAPDRNLYDAAGYGQSIPNWGVTLSDLASKGVHFAVCGEATEKIAEMIAAGSKGDAAKVHEDLANHLIANGHMVTAGIVAVNRAQERGYALASTG